MRWECRYSSCEIMYVEVGLRDVRCYLDHSEDRADHYTFEQVLDGAMDNEVGSVFGAQVLQELKAAVRNVI